jgi:hypothetical protein
MHEDDLPTAYVVVQQKSLKDDPHVPRVIKRLLQWVYFRYGWAAVDHDGRSYCKLEFVGVFDSAAAARWAAMIPGGSYRELPLNNSLPEETCQFRVHDFPASPISADYRNRKLPFIAIPRAVFERKVEKIIESASA